MFRAGDVVECVDSSGVAEVGEGLTYIVEKMSPKRLFVFLRGLDGGYFPERFRLVEELRATLSLEDML